MCCDELVLGSDAKKQSELTTGFPFLPLCHWLKKNILNLVVVLYQDTLVCIGPFGLLKKNNLCHS